MMISVNKQYILEAAQTILEIDSPSGFCYEVMKEIEKRAVGFGYLFERTNKGCGIITIPGKSNEKVMGLSAHVDTLGAMVRSITSSGTLKFTLVGGPTPATLDSEYCKIRTREGKIYTGTFLSTSPAAHVYEDSSLKFTLVGGPTPATLDSEYCKIRTREGKIYTGTFLSTSPAAHVYEDSSTKERKPNHMEIRIDEVVRSKEEVEALGICAGDYVFIEPKTVITESGFIKSRFIDDKGSVAALMGLMELFSREQVTPNFTTKIFISVYEEVGHGSSYIPDDITEMIAVDMGCIGEDLNCSEYDVSICAKDSAGPYDYEMTTELINLAKANDIKYVVDIYPMYSSDVSAALVSICAKDSAGPYDYEMTTELINLAKANDIKYVVDIYPMYSSDVSAALRGGNDIRGALIGPGVHASHGMERTHYMALESTVKLLFLYLTK